MQLAAEKNRLRHWTDSEGLGSFGPWGRARRHMAQAAARLFLAVFPHRSHFAMHIFTVPEMFFFGWVMLS
jgi:hypothetical protein